MARATRLPEMLAPVAFEFARRDDVGLADQARPKATGLHLMAKRRGRQPELVASSGCRVEFSGHAVRPACAGLEVASKAGGQGASSGSIGQSEKE